jgi:hypothetical protein
MIEISISFQIFSVSLSYRYILNLVFRIEELRILRERQSSRNILTQKFAVASISIRSLFNDRENEPTNTRSLHNVKVSSVTLDWVLDLLTTLTHDLWLRLIIAP